MQNTLQHRKYIYPCTHLYTNDIENQRFVWCAGGGKEITKWKKTEGISLQRPNLVTAPLGEKQAASHCNPNHL